MALVLAAVMVMAMGMTAFAADDGSIKVVNPTKGQTYQAFLIFTASPSNPDDVTSNIIYTATAEQVKISGFDDYFDKIIDEKGNYSITKKSGANDDALITWIKNNINVLKQGDAINGTWTNDTVVFDSLAYGYYYITSSLGSVVTIDTAGKDISVYDKNESTPTGPVKNITAEDSAIDESLDQSGVKETANNTSVGSKETFTVKFDATNWVKKNDDTQTGGSGTTGTKVTEWNFMDTPTGLAIDASTVKIYVNGTDTAHDVTSTVTDIAVDSTTGVLTFTIPWVDAQGNHRYSTQTEGSELIPVTVVYDATITADAATAAAPNTVTVKYNNKTQVGEATTTTYTYKFKLEKQDEKKEPLTGAKFELYFGESIAEDATPLTFTKVSDGNYRYDPAGTVTQIEPVGTGAEAVITGLDDTKYMLREVVAPAGYTKAADQAVTGLSRVDVEEASMTTVTVENLKGSELPSTGGMGTTLFYVVGAILVIGAGVVLVARRRMGAEK